MRKPYCVILVLGGVIFTLAICIALWNSRPDDVRSHLARFNRIKFTGQAGPYHLKHYLQGETWLWYWRGRPSTERWKAEALEEERDALIKLGYFVVREFPLQHRTFDKRLLMELFSSVHNAPTGFLTDRNFHTFGFGSTPSNRVRLAVCKDDVVAFEWIMIALDARK